MPLWQSEGEALETSGSRPLVLDDADSLWIVETGQVELFTTVAQSQQADEEEEALGGSRSHCMTLTPGLAFFGMELPNTFSLIAVGRQGTVLRHISRRRLRKLAGLKKGREAVTGILSTWVEELSRGLVRHSQPRPVMDAELLPGEPAALKRDERACSRKGLLWLEAEAAGSLFIGMRSLQLNPEALFPITEESWIESGPPLQLLPHETEPVVDDERLWRGLDAFHEIWCQCEAVNRQLELYQDFNRLSTKREFARKAPEIAARSLARVMMKDKDAYEVPDPGEDPLMVALSRIAKAQGLRIKGHPDATEDKDFEERLSILTKGSGVRSRVVALRDDWWRRDQGPFLARLEDDGTPVALIPRSATAYDLYRPEGPSRLLRRQRVSEDVAASLQGMGHVLYRPLPDGPVNARGLVRFGIRGLGRDFLTVAAMGVFVGVLSMVVPMVTGQIFDSAVPEAERELLFQLAMALLMAAFASAAFKLAQNVAVLRIQGKMDYAVQSALWDRLLNLPTQFFRKYTAGDLADRASGVNAIRHVIAGTGVAAVLGSISSVFSVALMFYFSLRLATVALGLTLVFLIFTTIMNLLQLRYQTVLFEVRGRITGLVLQLVTGVAKLRVAGAEGHAFRVWADQFSEQRILAFTIGRIQNAVQVFNASFPIFANLTVFGTLAWMTTAAKAGGSEAPLSTGAFIAFSAAFGQFLTATQSLADASMELLRVIPIYRRLKPILSTEAETDETRAYPGTIKGEIELSHVHFRYTEDGPWVIKDLSITIKPGELVAFVGSSGSGKSTLMRLMLGFEKPEKGSIYYDGQNLSALDVGQLRQQLGVVLQESKLLPADIYRNIVGTTSRTVDDALEAAKLAGLDEDIKAMPMGVHTYVSEGGGGFSGGQKQRLLIARALVNKPKIVFMDEATSALDNRTQGIVTHSLERLQATRIVIAHHLSTIINAKRICYLEGGVITEMGTYDELMALEGSFYRLARRQLLKTFAHLPTTPMQFPLPDEPHLEAWRAYAAEAAQIGVLPTLASKLVQLSFPVEAGISQTPAYRAATLRGHLEVPGTSQTLFSQPHNEVPNEVPDTSQPPLLQGQNEVPGTSLEALQTGRRGVFHAPEEVQLSITETAAGGLPVLRIPHRHDFVTLVRMLTARNEPAPVPNTMGACLVSGLNNWHRIRLLRRRWLEDRQENHQDASPEAWAEAFRELRERKELYQDRFVLLGEGPYSGVPAADLGLEEEEWKALSARIRLAHESAHYLTWRVHGPAPDPWLEEVLADFAGLVTAAGDYREDWALRFLGLDHSGYHQGGGRLENYRGDPPLSDEASRSLGPTLAAAVRRLARWAASVELVTSEALAHAILHLRTGTLEDLASGLALPEAPVAATHDGALHG